MLEHMFSSAFAWQIHFARSYTCLYWHLYDEVWKHVWCLVFVVDTFYFWILIFCCVVYSSLFIGFLRFSLDPWNLKYIIWTIYIHIQIHITPSLAGILINIQKTIEQFWLCTFVQTYNTFVCNEHRCFRVMEWGPCLCDYNIQMTYDH